MTNPEFLKAGKVPGLQLWRVENFKLAPVCDEEIGNFYIGDSYVMLHTSPSTPPTYNIFTWIGNDTSLDEKASAAIFMIQMDEYLGNSPVQTTEYQNQESNKFMRHFKKGIKYLTGGVKSGLKHEKTNTRDVKRMLLVKGRHVIRTTEVPFSWESCNNGDCFILDFGEMIYVWRPPKVNPFESMKAIEVANGIRDNESHGRADVEIISAGSEPEEVLKELGPLPDLPDAPYDDDTPDKTNQWDASLYVISDATTTMVTTKVQDKNPFKQEDLSQKECYIVDNGKNKKIFVWKGMEASKEERKAAFNVATKFIRDNNYDEKTQIQVMSSDSVTELFKQFFDNWLDKDETTGPSDPYVLGRIAKVDKIPFDASTLHTDSNMAALYSMIDDGSGKVKIWRVEKGERVPMDESTYGQFFGGDCYLLLYTYNTGGREKHIIYTWQGQKCSQDELTASAILTVDLDNSMDGAATQVRVTQGQEPPHLVSIFKGKPLIIHLGGTCSDHGQSHAASTRLFHIRKSIININRAVEVEPTASFLNSSDAFVLKTPDSLFIWKGKGATPGEIDTANYVAELLGGSPTKVQENKEPGGFWNALGGKKSYQTSQTLQNMPREPKLFGCSNKTGRLIAEQVPGEFIQLDLAPDDVMILDTWNQLFVWVGKEANETEKNGSLTIAQEYLKSDPSTRTDIPIVKIKMGEEPPSFTGWFHPWDPQMWEKHFQDCSHH